MNESAIRTEKKLLESRYGPWTAHNIHLGGGLFTMDNAVLGDEIKLRRIVQIVADLGGRPVETLRILDLACLEGMYAIELARRGATVVAVEGRKANIEKAAFSRRALGLENVEFRLDDVRNIGRSAWGSFDIVLCLGILYHLDAPDVFKFMEGVFDVCGKFTIIDTRISLTAEDEFHYRGRIYRGRASEEHPPGTRPDEMERRLWSSLGNTRSVRLTRRSLYSLLWDVGFSSAYECHVPQEPLKPPDRITLVAVKGKVEPLLVCPQLAPDDARELPEKAALLTPRLRRALRFLEKRLPRGVRNALARAAGRRIVDRDNPSIRSSGSA